MDCKSMKCWSFVKNITVLHINAPFLMPSSNSIVFGTSCLEGTIVVPRELFIYLLWKLYSEYSNKKKRLKRRTTLVNAKHSVGTPEGHFVLYGVIRGHAGLSSNSGVFGNGYPIHCINTYPCFRSTFKRHILELLI